MKVSRLHLVAAMRSLQLAYENAVDERDPRAWLINRVGKIVASLIGPRPGERVRRAVELS